MQGLIVISSQKKVTSEWNTIKRKAKLFFDYNQNSRGKTIASVYSVRPTMSVSWNKLEEIRPTDFTPKTVLESTIGKRDEWEGVLKNKQDFGKILSTVKEMII